MRRFASSCAVVLSLGCVALVGCSSSESGSADNANSAAIANRTSEFTEIYGKTVLTDFRKQIAPKVVAMLGGQKDPSMGDAPVPMELPDVDADSVTASKVEIGSFGRVYADDFDFKDSKQTLKDVTWSKARLDAPWIPAAAGKDKVVCNPQPGPAGQPSCANGDEMFSFVAIIEPENKPGSEGKAKWVVLAKGAGFANPSASGKKFMLTSLSLDCQSTSARICPKAQ